MEIPEVLGRYRILKKLGQGGMGEVYLAQDTQLARRVAIKVLPPETSETQGRLQRFIQEAYAVSALNHPAIIVIHEIGADQGIHFMATEYVEGLTVRDLMLNEEFSIKRIVEIGTQVASALVAAHSAGFIHRDLKPENIMVRPDGFVKVLDFGLSKLVQRDDLSPGDTPTMAYTAEGMIVGTVGYMSPEQIRTDRLDQRTDIFSLGVILYELVAGRSPFKKDSVTGTLAAIADERDPYPLARYNDNVPSELQRIISKALRKNKDERYQTSKDLLLDLQSLRDQITFEMKFGQQAEEPVLRNTTVHQSATIEAQRRTRLETQAVPVTKSRRSTYLALLGSLILVIIVAAGIFYRSGSSGRILDSVAIIPFSNVSGNPENEFLSDGIGENITSSLSKLPGLRVTAMTTVARYKGRTIDPQVIGRDLGVKALVIGRLSNQGATPTVGIEIVDTSNGSQVWGDQYTLAAADIYGMEQEISRDIVNKLRLQSADGGQPQLATRYVPNAQAYETFLKGRYYSTKVSLDGRRRAIDYFQQAVKEDPKFAAAHAGLADAYATLAFSSMPPTEAMPKSKEALQQAIELDPNVSEAHVSLAFALDRYDWDWTGAEREYRRAVELDAKSSFAHARYSLYLARMKRWEEAIAQANLARQLEPQSLLANLDLGWIYYFAGRYDEAIAQLERTLEIDEKFNFARYVLALTYEQKRAYSLAVEHMDRARQASDDVTFLAGLSRVLATAGREKESRKALDDVLALSQRSYVGPFFVATVYAARKEKEQAFNWLERAATEKDLNLVYLPVEPAFDPYKNDARYVAVVRQMHLN